MYSKYLMTWKFCEEILAFISFTKDEILGYFNVDLCITSRYKCFCGTKIIRISVQGLKKLKHNYFLRITVTCIQSIIISDGLSKPRYSWEIKKYSLLQPFLLHYPTWIKKKELQLEEDDGFQWYLVRSNCQLHKTLKSTSSFSVN